MFSKEHLIKIYTLAVHKFSNLIHQADKGEGCNKSQTLVEMSRDLSCGGSLKHRRIMPQPQNPTRQLGLVRSHRFSQRRKTLQDSLSLSPRAWRLIACLSMARTVNTRRPRVLACKHQRRDTVFFRPRRIRWLFWCWLYNFAKKQVTFG